MTWLCIYRVSIVLVNFILVFTLGYDFKAFDDTIHYKIEWPGKSGTNLLEQQVKAEPYPIISANNEKYVCYIPETIEEEIAEEKEYTGPNAIIILSLLATQKTCSFRLESYWTYELCHGKHVRQYHEERDGKKVKVQTYILGKFNATQIKKLSDEYDEQAKNSYRKADIPVKKIDGINMPYVEIEMTNGTLCDLNDKPRSIKILYVCYQHGKHEIYSIKETATCEYEAIVLTPVLCMHPDYRPQDTEEKKINCMPVDSAPKKPKALKAMEAESLKLIHQTVMDEKPRKVLAVFHIDKDGQNGQQQARLEIHPADFNGKHYNIYDSLNSLNDRGTSLTKSNSIENFLSGHNCLSGGNGWWKYEFCYGRLVTQYHIESGGTKTFLSLGVFLREKHMEWIDANPHKRPKPIGQRKQISHFYSLGTVCDKTGKPRQTEVKLKCVTNPAGSPSSVSLYLLEPKICEYVLGVESPLICDILEHADDTYGIISDKILVNFDELKTNLQVDDDDERIANGDE